MFDLIGRVVVVGSIRGVAMGSLYIAIPGAGTAAPVEVATTTALRTVLQVATPSTTRIRVAGWGISFDGVTSSDPAGQVILTDTTVAATTGTSLTADKWGSDDAPTSLCIGGAALTAYALTVEGTPGASRLIDSQQVHPQTGYSVWFPDSTRARIDVSRFLRVRVSFSVSINCIPWVVYEEPA